MFENINLSLVYKIILSAPKKDSKYIKGNAKRILLNDKEVMQFELFTKTQAFHFNIEFSKLSNYLEDTFVNYFTQASIMTNEYVYGFRMTSKGHLLTNKKKASEKFVVLNNNKEKTYLLSEGMIIEPLIDLGVMTRDGKVVKAYFDKFKQINRFLSIIDDTLKDFDKDNINIIDFGCGKSYLTFIVYYYLTFVKKIKATMTGLDLKEDVIKHCNEIAKKYNYQNLKFEIGDISLYKPKEYCDMIITLHACDTATDFAMYHAIMLNTKYLLSVPCCQHEINLQLNKISEPLISKYGLVKDRFAAILTDSIRANILEYEGYDVSMIEFIDFAQTPKNILIRAIKNNKKNDESLKLVEDTLNKYNIHQTLYDLIKKNKA
jgi:hypothetical protein